MKSKLLKDILTDSKNTANNEPYMNLVQTPAEKKIRLLCRQYLEYSGLTVGMIKRRGSCPLPIGTRNLQRLLKGEPVSLKIQVKLLEHFGVNWDICIKE
jgi:hypothetical protein